MRDSGPLWAERRVRVCCVRVALCRELATACKRERTDFVKFCLNGDGLNRHIDVADTPHYVAHGAHAFLVRAVSGFGHLR